MLASILAAFTPPASDEGVEQRPPRYAGEDTTPTSHREVLGWYSYGIAAEVFAVCGVGKLTSGLPIIAMNGILIAQSRVLPALDPRTACSREWHPTNKPFALLGTPGTRQQGR